MLLANSCARIGLILFASCCVANALHIDVKGKGNWIWFGEDKPAQGWKGLGTKTDDSVALDGYKYYIPSSSYVDGIKVNGSDSLASISTNKSFSVGTLTLQGYTSTIVAGSYQTTNCADSVQCAVFNVTNLILESKKGTNGNIKDEESINLRRINAKNTIITGDGVVNIAESGKTDTKATNSTNLGNVVVKDTKNGGVTIKSNSTATASANSITIEKDATLKLDNIQGDFNVTTLEVESGATVSANATNGKLSVQNIVAEAGAKGLDTLGDILSTANLTITAVKSKTIADFFSDKTTLTKLGNLNDKSEGVTITHNAVDNGIIKYSGDTATIIAKNGNDYYASTGTTNLKVEVSNKLQASLDNAYLTHHILLSNTMMMNHKLFLFDNYQNDNKEYTEKQFKNHETAKDEVKDFVDSWVDYEYNNMTQYGDALNANTHSVQLGVGFLRTNTIKVGGFFRYTYLGVKNENIGNTYATHAYNAGLYGVANIWTNGYLRGQFAYTGINAKGNYTLRDDKAGTNTSGVLKDSFHYLTTSIGVAQEGVMWDRFWGSIALDVAHIAPLIEQSQFDEYNFSKNSITFAALTGAFGVKIFDTMIYATGQVGYAISSRDREIDLKQRAMSDFYADGTAQSGSNAQWQSNFGIINDYKYNMIVGDLGIGIAYNFTKTLKGSAYLGAGFYDNQRPFLKANAGLSYLF